MRSRSILKNAKKMGILLDSKTFEERLKKEDRLSIAILSYFNSSHLDFVRSPLNTKYTQLNKIREYEIERDENSEIKGIIIKYKAFISQSAFHYKARYIQKAAQEIFKKENISKDELDDITTVFVQAVLNSKDITFHSLNNSPFMKYEGLEKPNIYITNNPILLENRYWFESRLPGHPLNIISIEESSLLLSAFFKKNEMYCASCRLKFDKFLWYWFSMRLKLPHYNVGDDITNSIANRVYFILMALDEITIQYYLGSNNVTMDTTLYHFNYLISLISGVFDSLALKTNKELNINWQNQVQITLSNKRGKGIFLKEIEKTNSDIRNHISTHVNFIELILSLRNVIIHKEGLPNTHFSYKSDLSEWNANFVEIEQTTYNYIKSCGDTICKEGKLTKWGVYKSSDSYMLEPYQFSIEAISILTKFVDEYLRLLGNSSFIEDQKQQNTDFAGNLKTFEKYHLGF